MSYIKKIFSIFYAFFCNTINIYNYSKFKNIYKKNILLNDVSDFTDIKNKRLNSHNDICNHFDDLFYEVALKKPKFILELGVRKGESTFVFNKIQKIFKNIFVSVDIEDCSDVIDDPDWIFIKDDSIKFLENFNTWSKNNTNSARPDIIFIDTSHLFEETFTEINLSAKVIADNGAIIFHDTNHNHITSLGNNIVYNKFNYSPQLGVKLALEKYFNCKFNFQNQFVITNKGWLIKHYPVSFGLTIMRKLN